MIEVSPDSGANAVFEVAELGSYGKTIWKLNCWREWLYPNEVTHSTDVMSTR